MSTSTTRPSAKVPRKPSNAPLRIEALQHEPEAGDVEDGQAAEDGAGGGATQPRGEPVQCGGERKSEHADDGKQVAGLHEPLRAALGEVVVRPVQAPEQA